MPRCSPARDLPPAPSGLYSLVMFLDEWAVLGPFPPLHIREHKAISRKMDVAL